MRLGRHEGELWTRLGASLLTGFRPTPDDDRRGLRSTHRRLNLRPSAIVASMAQEKHRELLTLLLEACTRAVTYGDVLRSIPGIRLPARVNRTGGNTQ